MVKHWWWLSFSSDAGWIGGALVDGADFPEAHANSWIHECNPGKCEVSAIELGDGTDTKLAPMEPYKLYSREALNALGISVEKFG